MRDLRNLTASWRTRGVVATGRAGVAIAICAGAAAGGIGGCAASERASAMRVRGMAARALPGDGTTLAVYRPARLDRASADGELVLRASDDSSVGIVR